MRQSHHQPRAKISVPCVQCSKLTATTDASSIKTTDAASKNQSQCFSCLDSMAPLACSSPSQEGCWDPEGQPAACRTCSFEAQHHNVCLACLQNKPYHHYMCLACAGLDPWRQERCYQCVFASQHTGGGRYNCMWQKDPAEQQQCLACLADPLRTDGKHYCVSCMDWCDTYESRAKCMQCLTTTKAGPGDKQWYKCSCKPDSRPRSGFAHATVGY